MAPTPQEHVLAEQDVVPPQMDGNRVVISGMAGLYPQSLNVKEFSDLLYNKVNPITSADLRYHFNHPEVVQHTGSIPDLRRFDAQFFKVHYRLGNAMDPMGRKVLEQTYQAIYDAGVNPEDLSGKKVGVYIGSCYSETEKACFYEAASRSGFGIAGCSKTMFANRISYWLNAKGPSMAIDEACCSSTAALEQAYLAMTRGECEAAVVGGSYLCLHPQSSVHYGRIINLCKDGKTKSFDEHADGCAKSEAINVLFLQKAKDALRIYATVLHAKTEFISTLIDKTGPKYGFYRSLSSTTNFIKKFYEDAKISPEAIEYVEAFGSALPEADKVELQAIEEVFCKNRDDPLLIGSVMSNIGYGEAASGISAITKVLLGYHSGKLAANLHCNQPRKDIAALRDGRMRVVTEHQTFDRTYCAVNGMSVTGVNSHVLLHGFNKPKDIHRYKTSIPYLVTISGRHEEAVKNVLEILKTNPIDPEQIALLHNIHRSSVAGHLGRGFTILQTNSEQKTVSLSERAEYFDDAKRPLWFVYSGMGSQWAGMGAQLMRIPIFAAAIERCRKALEPKGLDIVHIITSPDETIFNNILHSFVGIAAVQIGLTDILRELGLKPDGIIGHSVGELGCAYADGCLTAEEMILSAYYRGLVSLETKFIHGSMAAVGMGYEQIIGLCPPEIEVACHNGPESSTISGPSDVMKQFVAELTAKGIFAKEVPCSNIAYHSRYIADAGPGLLKYLREAIITPKARSERWISSSVPQDRWDEPIAKFCSAEYLTNNLLNPVLFEETSRLVPSNAVLVEIAPHGLLQAILKRSMPPSCINVSLTRRKHPDNIFLLLEAIGKLYMEGYNSNVHVLYPKVEMPVSTGTPFLSHFVKWAHGEVWPLPLYASAHRRTASSCHFVLSLHDKEHTYLSGHSMRGNIVYPFAAILTLAWDTLAMMKGVPKKQLSVEFNDVQLHAQPILHDRRQLKISVSLHRGTGRFEILDGSSEIATGIINPLQGAIKYEVDEEKYTKHFTSEDVYQLLSDRDYSYNGEFKSIESVDESLSKASLLWRDNWVTLMDGMLQLNVLRQSHDGVSRPKNIRRIYIDVNEHNNLIANIDTSNHNAVMKAQVFEKYDCTRCGGILMESIVFHNLPPVNDVNMSIKPLELVASPQLDMNNNQVMESSPMKPSEMKLKNVTLQAEEFGNFHSLKWVDATEVTGSGIPVTVYYAGISDYDIKKASGAFLRDLNVDHSYGSDFSGITKSGVRVMGIVPRGAASSEVVVQPELLWPLPPHWSLEDAATVPLAYLQAFYCLGIKAKLYPGLSILVHEGADALGQAAISIALAYGCEVFTTVSDIRKKHFLLKLFPELKADNIGNSRDNSFEDMILSATKGNGCQIVISCVQGNLKNASMRCVSAMGMCFDISQIQNKDHYSLGMYHLNKERNYYSIDFNTIFNGENMEDVKVLSNLVSAGIARGYVRPLSRVTYAPYEVTRAFRLLAANSHRGRVLLRMQHQAIQSQHRLKCDAYHTHVVLCDGTSFGLQFVQRLITRGVKKLCLHVQAESSYLQQKIRTWSNMGVEVIVSTVDLNQHNGVITLLKQASGLGAIEGIYVAQGEVDSVSNNFIKDLDTASRNLCPEIRYFALFNAGDNSIARDVYGRRVNDRLPVTMLVLPEQKQEFGSSNWRGAVEAADQALRCTRGRFLVTRKDVLQHLLKKIAAIAGVSIPDDVEKTVTLQELGVQKHTLKMIRSFLQDQYNLAFNEDQISLLTIDAILELEKTIIELPYDNNKGLKTFFNYVDSDELFATTEMVFLPTLVNSSSMRDDEFDQSQRYMYLVPGMEGHHERFRVMCERLKLPAIVMQPGLDHPNETVRDTAERMTEVLLKKTGIKDKFYLLGYESGVFVALEIAAILEEHGLTGTVFCVGCAPDEFDKELDEQLSEFKTEEQLQDGVLRHMFTLMAGSDTAPLEKALQKANTWSQKIDACVRTLLGRVSHSAQYARALIETALARIKQVRKYKAAVRPLRSQLVLLRAATTHSPPQQTGLQQHSQLPVAVHQLRAPFADTTTDLRCTAIINEYLDPVILEDFSTRDLCDTYILNANSFMSIETGDD